ncbi:hypothetical protein HAX54_036970, partial [Datura stramonium]|nr:hypothetical protein [Datura stramonium]
MSGLSSRGESRRAGEWARYYNSTVLIDGQICNPRSREEILAVGALACSELLLFCFRTVTTQRERGCKSVLDLLRDWELQDYEFMALCPPEFSAENVNEDCEELYRLVYLGWTTPYYDRCGRRHFEGCREKESLFAFIYKGANIRSRIALLENRMVRVKEEHTSNRAPPHKHLPKKSSTRARQRI